MFAGEATFPRPSMQKQPLHRNILTGPPIEEKWHPMTVLTVYPPARDAADIATLFTPLHQAEN